MVDYFELEIITVDMPHFVIMKSFFYIEVHYEGNTFNNINVYYVFER